MTTKPTGQHTPGPWKVTNSLMVMSKTNRSIADCCIGYSGGSPLKTGLTNACNARLIAAAPDMLLALGAIMDQAEIGNLSRKHPSVDSAIRRVLAAITIATKED